MTDKYIVAIDDSKLNLDVIDKILKYNNIPNSTGVITNVPAITNATTDGKPSSFTKFTIMKYVIPPRIPGSKWNMIDCHIACSLISSGGMFIFI